MLNFNKNSDNYRFIASEIKASTAANSLKLKSSESTSTSYIDISQDTIQLVSENFDWDANGGAIHLLNSYLMIAHKDIIYITGRDHIQLHGNTLPMRAPAQMGGHAYQLPTSESTYSIKTNDLSNSDLSGAGLDLTNTWCVAEGWDISRVLLSRYSNIKMEFKVNFITSPNADSKLSFRVIRYCHDISSPVWTNSESNIVVDLTHNDVVFTDNNIGPNTGSSFHGVYNGSYIDTPNSTFDGGIAHYQLVFKREGSNDVSYGIIPGGNYIYLQELYVPIIE